MTHTLILVKHSTSAARSGQPPSQWPLTYDGRDRARVLATHLAGYQPSCILSSDMPKAKQTAAIVAAELNMSYKTHPDLHEHKRDKNAPYFDKVADFKAAVRRVLTERDQLVYGEETGDEALARFRRGLDAAIQQGNPCVVIAHGTVISLVLGDMIPTLDTVALWESLKLPSFVVVKIDEGVASIEKIVTDAGNPPNSR
jgi:broad specificity phosphatase PhoE